MSRKEGIYVVQTNLEQHNMKPSNNEFHIQTRSGVKKQGGPVVKIGKTTNFASRFAGYASHNGGSRSSRTDQGGIRILYVLFLNKKSLFTTGKSYLMTRMDDSPRRATATCPASPRPAPIRRAG